MNDKTSMHATEECARIAAQLRTRTESQIVGTENPDLRLNIKFKEGGIIAWDKPNLTHIALQSAVKRLSSEIDDLEHKLKSSSMLAIAATDSNELQALRIQFLTAELDRINLSPWAAMTKFLRRAIHCSRDVHYRMIRDNALDNDICAPGTCQDCGYNDEGLKWPMPPN